MQLFVPVSHCKDTHYFDKTNNFFKKVKEKGDQVYDLLCPKLSELPCFQVSQSVRGLVLYAFCYDRITLFHSIISVLLLVAPASLELIMALPKEQPQTIARVFSGEEPYHDNLNVPIPLQ